MWILYQCIVNVALVAGIWILWNIEREKRIQMGKDLTRLLLQLRKDTLKAIEDSGAKIGKIAASEERFAKIEDRLSTVEAKFHVSRP